jgi:hypothetical protein
MNKHNANPSSAHCPNCGFNNTSWLTLIRSVFWLRCHGCELSLQILESSVLLVTLNKRNYCMARSVAVSSHMNSFVFNMYHSWY